MAINFRPLDSATPEYSSEAESLFRRQVESYLLSLSAGVTEAIEAKNSGASLSSKRENFLSQIYGETSLNDVTDDVFNVKSYGATGDGVTDDTSAIQAAIDAWRDASNGVLGFPSGEYLCNSGLTTVFTSNEVSGKTIDGYGAVLISGVTSGDFWTIESQAVVRNLSINGLTIRATVGNGESSLIHLDGGDGASTQYLYSCSFNDVRLERFTNHGWHIENNVFESDWNACSSRTSGTLGNCFFFEDGASGAVSSISLNGCNTSGGLRGLYIKTPVSDVRVSGGTYILAQEEGIRFEDCAGGSIIQVHVENNWESSTDLASGGAGCLIAGRGSVIGLNATTNSKQRFGLKLYVSAGFTSTVIGGVATGDTEKFLEVVGDSGSSAGTVDLFSNASVHITTNDVKVNRFGVGGIQLGDGDTNNQGKFGAKSSGAGFEQIMHRWTGVADNFYAYRWNDASSSTLDMQVSPSNVYGSESWTTALTIANSGEVRMPGLSLTDGISAPAAVVGYAQIYVDTADGDLKVKFGDGHVATIATDS